MHNIAFRLFFFQNNGKEQWYFINPSTKISLFFVSLSELTRENMNIKKTLVIILCFISYSVYAQNNPKTLLWKVTQKGNSHVSYLFGTFHQVNPDFFDSLSIANDCLKKSKILFVESYIPEKKTDSVETTSKNDSVKFEIWDKERWKSNLTNKQFDAFEKFAKSEWVDENVYGVDPVQLMFILQYMYYQGVCDTLNRTSYESMDTRITNIGIANKLRVIGLDENQLKEIKISSEKDKALSLKNTIIADATYVSYLLEKSTDNPIAKFLFDYRNKNLNYSLNKKMKLLNSLLNERNNKWMKKILNQFDTNSCFVAVGIRHLFYKDGLIQQLRKQGYKVEPVEN